MASNYQRRLEKLEEAFSAIVNRPLALRFLSLEPDTTLADIERIRDEELDRMIEAGVIGPAQRSRVRFVRWWTAEEAPPVDNDVIVQAEMPEMTSMSTEPIEEPARPKGFDLPLPNPA